MVGIYKLEWDNGYFYFGQSTCLEKRKIDHICRLKQGKHVNSKMQNVYNKYGEPKFIIVEECLISEITDREDFYIKSAFNDYFNCNLAPAGNSCLGIKRSQETKDKLSELAKKRIYTDERKKNISNSLILSYKTGVRQKPDLKKENNPFYNRKHTDEYKAKMSEKRKGLMVGAANGRAKKIKDTNTGCIYNCILDLAITLNISAPNLRKRLIKNKYPNYIKI